MNVFREDLFDSQGESLDFANGVGQGHSGTGIVGVNHTANPTTTMVLPDVSGKSPQSEHQHRTYQLGFTPSPPSLLHLSPTALDILKSFDVDPERGFLPPEDPLQRLSHPLYQQWEDLVTDLPCLLGASQVRTPLEQLQPLPIDLLQGYREQRRALLVLSMLCHAYVWGEPNHPIDVIPAGIAVPLWNLAAELGVPPVMTHMSIVLYNWRRLDPLGPIATGNLAPLCQFLGGQDEAWFYLITVEIEARGGAAMGYLVQARESAVVALTSPPDSEESRTAVKNVSQCLTAASACIRAMKDALSRMSQGCDPRIFYHRVRPFLSGWRANPTMPSGVEYGGIGERRSFYGGSAAQCTLFPALDAALGVNHGPLTPDSFLFHMREYMPPKHSQFINYLATPLLHVDRESHDADFGAELLINSATAHSANPKRSSSGLGCSSCCSSNGDSGDHSILGLHDFVGTEIGSAAAPALKEALNNLEAFRTHHIGIVTAFILLQQKDNSGRPAGEGATEVQAGVPYTRDKAAGAKGTGGTGLLEFLRPLRNNVKDAFFRLKK